MNCDACREVLSARLDGEDLSLDDRAADAHLRGCAGCQEFQRAAAQMHRSVRVRPAEWGPDLSGRILARIGAEVQPTGSARGSSLADRQRDLRIALMVMAVLQVAFAVPLLLSGGSDEVAHTGRELASFDAALAVGFLVCAWQPARVPGLLPVAGALSAFLAVTAGMDVVSGRAALETETVHLLEVVGVVLLWLLGRLGGGPVRGNRPGPVPVSGDGRPVTSR
jgi:predicted anti-sigma-YlaC factor YlaD